MKIDPIKDKKIEKLMGDLYLLQVEHENIYFDSLNGKDVKVKIKENESKQIPILNFAIEYLESKFPEHIVARNEITRLRKNLKRLENI